MKRGSLTFQLSALVALAILVVGGVAGIWSYVQALQEARNRQDDVLIQVASIAAATTSKAAVPVDESPLSDSASDIDVTSLKRSGLPATTPNGLGNAEIAGQARRVFVIRGSTGSELVVSQSIQVRHEAADAAALAAVIPLLALLPLLLLAIFVVVGRVMRPVNQLADEVRARTATDLSPLEAERAPSELRGFLVALNAQFDKAGAALDRERLFIAEAAHELRTPLTAMSLQLERAANAPDSAVLRDRLSALGSGVERSRHLIDQLLDLARAQTDSIEAPAEQRFDTIIRNVLRDVLPLADRAQVELEVQAAAAADLSLPVVAITSVLRNLLDNAVRYSPSGGLVVVATQQQDDHLIVSVDDAGPGIASPKAMLRPFAREAGQDSQGSGLGLAIVSEQIRHLNGRLEFRSSRRFATGTEVVITLPIHEGRVGK